MKNTFGNDGTILQEMHLIYRGRKVSDEKNKLKILDSKKMIKLVLDFEKAETNKIQKGIHRKVRWYNMNEDSKKMKPFYFEKLKLITRFRARPIFKRINSKNEFVENASKDVLGIKNKRIVTINGTDLGETVVNENPDNLAGCIYAKLAARQDVVHCSKSFSFITSEV